MPLDGLRRTKSWAGKYTIANTTDHILHRRYDGYFDPLYLLREHSGGFPQACHIPSPTVGMLSLTARRSSS